MNIKEALSEILNDEEALNNKPKHPRVWQMEHTWDFTICNAYRRRLSHIERRLYVYTQMTPSFIRTTYK